MYGTCRKSFKRVGKTIKIRYKMSKTIIDRGMNTFQGAPIRVTVAASVAFNPDSLKKGISGLMEKLGCGNCFSGFDCRFQLQRDYLIDPELKTQTITNASATGVSVVNVRLDKATAYNLDKIRGVIDNLHKKFGCAPCHSGLDLQFRNEINELAGNAF
jgi:hypothetical protein